MPGVKGHPDVRDAWEVWSPSIHFSPLLASALPLPGAPMEVQADADQAKGKVEEAKASLKELGLNDSVESSG